MRASEGDCQEEESIGGRCARANTFVGGIGRCYLMLSGNSLPTVQSWSLLDIVSRYLLSSSSYLLKTQAVFISVNHCWERLRVSGHTSKDAEIEWSLGSSLC